MKKKTSYSTNCRIKPIKCEHVVMTTTPITIGEGQKQYRMKKKIPFNEDKNKEYNKNTYK
jgi:hypothetical protein